VLHRSTEVPPSWEAFAVGDAGAVALPAARLLGKFAGVAIKEGPDGFLRADGDFASLVTGEKGLEVLAPPAWTVRATWNDGVRLRAPQANAGADSQVDLAEVLGQTAEARRRALEGDLELDAAELGRLVLRHSRTRNPETACQRLRELVDSRADQLSGFGTQFALLHALWLTPLLDVLGFETRDLSPDELTHAPAGTTAALLVRPTRQVGRVVRRADTILVLGAAGANFADMREFAERLCVRLEREAAFLTDGLRWARHRRGFPTLVRVWDLKEVTQPGSESRFTDFFFEFGG
jgi:hypothetical protein